MKVLEHGYEPDHIHFHLKSKPNSDLSKYINALKTQTSKTLRREFGGEIRKILWKDALWSQSYCLVTAGGAPLSVLKEYVENQGTEPGKERVKPRRTPKVFPKKSFKETRV